MDKTKKIALVLPCLNAGGMERVMSELAIYFCVQKKVEVHLILMTNQVIFYTLPAEVIIHEPYPKIYKKNSFWNAIKTMWYLRKKIITVNPTAVLSFGEMYNSFVLIATIFTSYKIYVSDRSKPDKNWGKYHHFLRYISYKRASGIIAQTQIAKEIMVKRLPHANVKIIGNPIKPMVSTTKIVRKNIILTVGRMVKSKRHDLLINLFNQTINKNWELHILGDGPEKQKLELLVSSLNLQDKVKFIGATNNVNFYYAKSKIFAFTSNSEGFPNALGEAMSAGLAAITFDFIAGASDLISDNENGFLIEMDEKAQYVHQLNALMQDDELINRLAKNAAESIKKFDTTVIAEEYYNFILA